MSEESDKVKLEKEQEESAKEEGDRSAAGNRRHRAMLKEDTESQRFECFCARQYLSYGALSGHVKSKHPDFYNSRQSYKNNLVETIDPVHRYKIKKLLREDVNFRHRDPHTPFRRPRTKRHIVDNASSEQAQSQAPYADYSQSQSMRPNEPIEVKLQSQQIINLQQRLITTSEENSDLKRQLLTCDRKREKCVMIIDEMRKIIECYEEILKTMKIEAINEELEKCDVKEESGGLDSCIFPDD